VTPEEAARFRELRLQALQQHPRAYAQTYDEESHQPDHAFAQFVTANVVLGAYADGTLIGFTILTPFRQSKLSHKGMVWGAYVQPSYRDMQLAQGMRLRLFEIAKGMGLRYVVSSIFASNAAALQVHKAVGYEETYVEKDGARHLDGTFEDIVHLVRYL
jgi:L-amino acid N-acyltransferase YncA